MARIGLTNLWYGILTESALGVATYGGAKSFGKAVSCSVEITNNEAKLYADDTLAESDTSFNNGTVTLGVDEDADEVFAEILGHSIDEETGEVIRTSQDTAPYIGLGRVITKMVNGVYKYKAEFLYKCKFAEPSNEENTKGESVEFVTPEIEGTVASLGDDKGTWSKSKTFTSKAEAVAYIKGLLGTTEQQTAEPTAEPTA